MILDWIYSLSQEFLLSSNFTSSLIIQLILGIEKSIPRQTHIWNIVSLVQKGSVGVFVWNTYTHPHPHTHDIYELRFEIEKKISWNFSLTKSRKTVKIYIQREDDQQSLGRPPKDRAPQAAWWAKLFFVGPIGLRRRIQLWTVLHNFQKLKTGQVIFFCEHMQMHA